MIPESKLDRFAALGVPILRYGARGAALVYVPTSQGDEKEFSGYAMTETCRRWIDGGKLQVFSVDGCGPRNLFDDALGARERVTAYADFERTLAGQVIPYIRELAPGPLTVIGASYGGFVAANLLFKYYDRVDFACAMGGVFGMWHRHDGHHDDDVYYHTPLEYLPRLEDPAILSGIRRTAGLMMYGARDDEWYEHTPRLARILNERELPHGVDIWDSPANHHERWWREQLESFLARRFPL